MLRAEGLWGAGWAGACRCQYTTDPYLNAYVKDVMFFNHALRWEGGAPGFECVAIRVSKVHVGPHLNAYVMDIMLVNHALRSAHSPVRPAGPISRLPPWRREAELSLDSESMPEPHLR